MKLDIEAIEKRCEAATEGEWWYDGEDFIFAGRDDPQMVAETRGFGANLPIDNNGDFIAHARQDIPSLIEEVERLRGEQEDTQEQLKATILAGREWMKKAQSLTPKKEPNLPSEVIEGEE